MYYHFQADNDEDIDFNEKLSSKQCEAVKSNGQQCRNKTVIGQIFCWIHRKHILNLQIKNSSLRNAGKGLFAYGRKNEIIFKPGQRICMYDGEIIDDEELADRYGEYTAPYAVQLHTRNGQEIYEDAGIERGLGSLANHSKNQSKLNARIGVSRQNRAQLIAIKNIKAGKEIFVDYGDDYIIDKDVCSSTNRKKSTC